MMVSNVALSNTTCTPRTWPMALPRSTSMPWIVVLSSAKNSFGAYEASVATMILPADLILAGSSAASAASADRAGAVVAVEPPAESLFLVLLPQAAATMSRAARTATSRVEGVRKGCLHQRGMRQYPV
jgi:hypothetical protein